MSESSEKQNKAAGAVEPKLVPRVRGVGDPESNSQDANRHRKQDHPKSDK